MLKDDDCFNCCAPLKDCTCGEAEGYCNVGAVCPYCGYVNEASESDGMLYDESITEWSCGSCDMEFKCSLATLHAWTTHRLKDHTDE